MHEKKVLCLLFILTIVPGNIDNLGIKVGLTGKSKLKNYRESCVYDRDCGYRLSCISYACRCQNNEFWNNTYCETKLVLFFTPSNYNTVIVDNFNRAQLVRTFDIKVIEKPTYYIYVAAFRPGVLVQYTQYGSYVRHVALGGVVGIQTVFDNSIYAGSGEIQTMYKYDSSLHIQYNSVPANTTYVITPWFIRYNPSNGYLYECDSTGYVNVFDLSYNRIESFKMDAGEEPISIGFYQDATSEKLLLVSTTTNKIKILKQANKTLYKTISSVCDSGNPYDILVDQKSGYFLVSCRLDSIIQLWKINGTEFVNTGKTISIDGPSGMCFDSSGRLLITSFLNGFFAILTLV